MDTTHDSMTDHFKLEVHVWPPKWGLASRDLQCFSTVCLLQLLAVHQHHHQRQGGAPQWSYQVVPTCPPYASTSLPAIYSSSSSQLLTTSSPPSLSTLLSLLPSSSSSPDPPTSELAAYTSLLLSTLTDLVHHTLFSTPTNWLDLLRPAFGQHVPIPWRYWVPMERRAAVAERLSERGVWGLGGNAEEVEKELERRRERRLRGDGMEEMERERLRAGVLGKKEKEDIKREFELSELKSLTRSRLTPFSSLLARSTTPYLLSTPDPSSLDVLLFAHLSFLLPSSVPLPDDTLSALLSTEFPSLIEHAERVRAYLFGEGAPAVRYGEFKGGNYPLTLLRSAVGYPLGMLPVPFDLFAGRGKRVRGKGARGRTGAGGGGDAIWWMTGVGFALGAVVVGEKYGRRLWSRY